MLLGYYTEEAYNDLLNGIDKNAEKYETNTPWVSELFSGRDNYFKISSTVEVNQFKPYITDISSDSEKSTNDLINVRQMYESFKNLSPLQASNKYMWTYLCHEIPEYYEYIQKRWMKNARENTIRTRFFVTNSSSLLNDNALSRLWWYGYLTYDESYSDHYELTKILLTNQTICTDLMDTLNRMDPNRIKGVLLAIKDFKEQYGEKGITDCFRDCNKKLNRYAAVTDLDFLSSDEIKNISFDFLVTAYNDKNKA